MFKSSNFCLIFKYFPTVSPQLPYLLNDLNDVIYPISRQNTYYEFFGTTQVQIWPLFNPIPQSLVAVSC